MKTLFLPLAVIYFTISGISMSDLLSKSHLTTRTLTTTYSGTIDKSSPSATVYFEFEPTSPSTFYVSYASANFGSGVEQASNIDAYVVFDSYTSTYKITGLIQFSNATYYFNDDEFTASVGPGY